MNRKFNKHQSGAGRLKVEKEMVKYFAIHANSAKSARCEKKAERNVVKRLKNVREIIRDRNAYTFRGLWNVTVDLGLFGSLNFNIHFSKVSETTDYVAGTLETTDRMVDGAFAGYEDLNIARIVDDSGDKYVLVINPTNKQQLSGGFYSKNGTDPLPVTGIRLMGP